MSHIPGASAPFAVASSVELAVPDPSNAQHLLLMITTWTIKFGMGKVALGAAQSSKPTFLEEAVARSERDSVASPSCGRITNRTRSSITEHFLHGMFYRASQQVACVTPVSGTFCYMSQAGRQPREQGC
jgi:hypothetical protein